MVLTNHKVSKTNGAKCNEGVVETLSIGPALHVAEDEWGEDQEEHAAHQQEQAHGQHLHTPLHSKHRTRIIRFLGT